MIIINLIIEKYRDATHYATPRSTETAPINLLEWKESKGEKYSLIPQSSN